MPNVFLVRYAEYYAKYYLTLLYRKPLARAEFPDNWTFAKIAPIPTSQDHSPPTSYRPISILCTSMKLLEHMIFKHISSFIDSNNSIDHREHAFRRVVSTVTQLALTIHDLALALDRHDQVDIIFFRLLRSSMSGWQRATPADTASKPLASPITRSAAKRLRYPNRFAHRRSAVALKHAPDASRWPAKQAHERS